MNYPRWFPRPASWAGAGALFVYSLGVTMAWGFALPLVFELMRHSPRLGWLAMLLLWVSPIGVAAAVHRASHGVLDFADKTGDTGGARDAMGGAGSASLWAGFVAWATILVVSFTTSLVMLVVSPPPAEPPDAATAMWSFFVDASSGASGLVRSAVWIALAACVYELERRARR